MHVLFLPSWYRTAELPWSGIFFENQALALAQAGVRVGVVYVERRSLRSMSLPHLRESHFQTTQSSALNVTTLRMKGWNTLGQTETGARLWAALSQRLATAYIARFGVPDVIHAHAALWAGRVAVRTARRVSRPCVVTEHSSQIMRGDLRPSERREVARTYREADAVLAVSTRLMAAVRSIAPLRTSRVVPNAIDFDFFSLPMTPRSTTPFTLISVSNLVMGKRVDALLKAFARASRTQPGLRLIVVGDGADADALVRLAHDLGVAAQVEFTGGLPPVGVREKLWKANALIMPSAFETFGVVLVEALATGIPVVATRCGGPEDIVDENVGLLVEPDNEAALARAMLTVANRSYSSNDLRNRVMDRYSFGHVARELLRVYTSVREVGSTQKLDSWRQSSAEHVW